MHTTVNFLCRSNNISESEMFSYGAISLITIYGVSVINGEKPDVAKKPILGWNSWNYFGCNISESVIKETVDAFVSLELNKFGYEYINLDDCWQSPERSEEDNRIYPDVTKFPNGMESIATYIHDRDLKFGIYSSAGFRTCGGFPASLGLEIYDADTYSSWTVDLLKYDNCYTDHSTPEQRYPRMADALQNTDRKIMYSLCEWGRENPAAWASKFAHSWRTCMDISDHWGSIVKNTAVNSVVWRYAGKNQWNDPDMLEVGNGGCTMEEYRSHFSLWAMMKAPLIIGNDIRTMEKDSELYDILTNSDVIAVNQDSLGIQGRRIWSDRLSTNNPEERLIATKCNPTTSGSSYLDAVADQQWVYNQADGTIMNPATNKCLVEVSSDDSHDTTNSGMLRVQYGSHIQSIDEVDVTSLSSRSGSGDTVQRKVNAVTTVSCDETANDVTTWTMHFGSGGMIQSQHSGYCLEVATFDLNVIAQGKKIQTSPCQQVVDAGDLGKSVLDIREHQQWVLINKNLVNLFQVLVLVLVLVLQYLLSCLMYEWMIGICLHMYICTECGLQ